MSPDDDQFTDGRLGFSIRKPPSWKFLPPAWSPVERAKRNLESDDFFRLAGKPFCCAVKEHGVRGFAHPTMQVVMRPFGTPSLGALPALLDALIDGTRHLHETLEVELRSPECIVAGYPAIGWRGRFQFQQLEDGVETIIGARSRTWMIFAHNLTYTVALASSDDPGYYDEADFDAILSSVRVR